MYPTRAAAAGQRPWRCPGCALWIALLLQSVLDLSASGESRPPLIVPLSLSPLCLAPLHSAGPICHENSLLGLYACALIWQWLYSGCKESIRH